MTKKHFIALAETIKAHNEGKRRVFGAETPSACALTPSNRMHLQTFAKRRIQTSIVSAGLATSQVRMGQAEAHAKR